MPKAATFKYLNWKRKNMRKITLYLAESIFLLLFWAFMFRQVKPSFTVTLAIFIAMAALFAAAEKMFTEKPNK